MAIILEESKNKTNWTMVILILFLFLFIAGGTYALFFTPTPAIERFAPSSQKLNAELSKVKVENSENEVTKHPLYKSVRQHSLPPSAAQTGRSNPFVRF